MLDMDFKVFLPSLVTCVIGLTFPAFFRLCLWRQQWTIKQMIPIKKVPATTSKNIATCSSPSVHPTFPRSIQAMMSVNRTSFLPSGSSVVVLFVEEFVLLTVCVRLPAMMSTPRHMANAYCFRGSMFLRGDGEHQWFCLSSLYCRVATSLRIDGHHIVKASQDTVWHYFHWT